MPISWGVLGTGAHVQRVMAPAFSRAADTTLAAVCSRELSRAEDVAHKFGFARAYDSFEEMLKDDAVEAIYICTPNALHAEQAIQAARAGKHVLVEKPMALTRAEAEAMVDACESAGVRLGVGFHLRHHPGQKDARRAIAEGRLGKAVVYDVRWIISGSRREGWWQDPTMIGAYIMMALGVHLIDLIRYLSGREPEAVTAMTDGQRAGRPLDETALATLRLGDDVFATLFATRHTAKAQNDFTVYGTEGLAEARGTVGVNPTGTLVIVAGESTVETSYHAKDPYQEEIEAFNRAVRDGTAPSASGLDGLQVVRITEAILESARTGRTVKL